MWKIRWSSLLSLISSRDRPFHSPEMPVCHSAHRDMWVPRANEVATCQLEETFWSVQPGIELQLDWLFDVNVGCKVYALIDSRSALNSQHSRQNSIPGVWKVVNWFSVDLLELWLVHKMAALIVCELWRKSPSFQPAAVSMPRNDLDSNLLNAIAYCLCHKARRSFTPDIVQSDTEDQRCIIILWSLIVVKLPEHHCPTTASATACSNKIMVSMHLRTSCISPNSLSISSRCLWSEGVLSWRSLSWRSHKSHKAFLVSFNPVASVNVSQPEYAHSLERLTQLFLHCLITHDNVESTSKAFVRELWNLCRGCPRGTSLLTLRVARICYLRFLCRMVEVLDVLIQWASSR